MIEGAKKKILKRILLLTADISNENLIRAIDVGDRFFIKDEKVRSHAKALKNYSKRFKEITDPVWEEDLSLRYKHWKDRNLMSCKFEDVRGKESFNICDLFTY